MMRQTLADEYPWQKWFYGLWGFSALVLLVRLGATPIYILDEAKNAQCAREMWYSGNWVVPTFNGELRTDKPPLHYWFMGLSYQLFGVGAWQARLFSAVAGIGTLWITHFFTRKWVGGGVAFFATLGLALSTHFMFEFRLAVPDPYLIFFTTLGIFSAFSYFSEKKWKWLLLASSALALATLAKGPVALALPGLIMLLYVLLSRQAALLLDGRLLAGVALYLAIAVPWYGLVHAQTGGAFTRGFFIEHNLERFSAEMEGHGGIFLLIPLMVFIGMLPAAVHYVKGLFPKTGLWSQPFLRCMIIGSLAYIIFFSLSSTKLPNYAMPCYPMVAVVAAACWYKAWQLQRLLPVWGFILLLVVAVSLPVAGFFALRQQPEVAQTAGFSWGLLVLLAGVLAAWWQAGKNYKRALAWLAGGYLVFNAYVLWVAYPAVYNHNPVSRAYSTVLPAHFRLMGYKIFNPAFLFQQPKHYLRVHTVQHAWQVQTIMVPQQQDTPTYLLTRKNLLLEVDTTHWKTVFSQPDLFELPTTVILRWQP